MSTTYAIYMRHATKATNTEYVWRTVHIQRYYSYGGHDEQRWEGRGGLLCLRLCGAGAYRAEYSAIRSRCEESPSQKEGSYQWISWIQWWYSVFCKKQDWPQERCDVMGLIETIIARGPGYDSQEELAYLHYVVASQSTNTMMNDRYHSTNATTVINMKRWQRRRTLRKRWPMMAKYDHLRQQQDHVKHERLTKTQQWADGYRE